MKKIMSFALAIMLIATMSVTAFAEEIKTDKGSASIPVKGTYQSSGATSDTISVVVEWKDMEFTYTAGEKGAWDTTNHKYGEDKAGSWSTNKGTITVKNHSDVAVTATLEWKQNSEITGKTITGTFSGNDVKTGNVLELVSANDDAYRSTDPNVAPAAPTATAQFGIDSTSDAIDQAYESLGTITVTIAKKTAE